MAGIQDLMGLFYWLDNDQDYLIEASLPAPAAASSAAPPQVREAKPADPTQVNSKPPANPQY